MSVAQDQINCPKMTKMQKKILIFAGIYVVVFVVGIFFINLMQNLENESFAKTRELKQNINVLNRKFSTLNKKIKEIKEAQEIWQTLSQRTRNANGLRIDEAQLLLKDLEKFHNLSGKINVDLSAPKELGNIYKTDNMAIVSSEVTIKFAGFTDEDLINFTNSIIKEFPGFIQISSFQLQKVNDINSQILREIRQGNRPEIVSGNLSFKWRDFKEIDDD